MSRLNRMPSRRARWCARTRAVIGSGAGERAAAELAEAGLDVILLEEGGPARRVDFNDNAARHVPLATIATVV